MKRYSSISDEAAQKIDAVHEIMKPVSEAFKEQIKGLTREEQNLLALEYMECLSCGLAEGRILEGIRRRKEERENRQ